MKSVLRTTWRSHVWRVLQVLLVIKLTAFSAAAQCNFTPAVLPTLTFPALPGNCLATAVKIPVPKSAPAGCQIAYNIFNTGFALVPLGDTSITIPVMPVGTTPIVWAFPNGSGGFYGNTSQNIVVNDLQAPTFTFCPPSVSVNLRPVRCDTVLTYNSPVAFDACGLNLAAPVLVSGLASGSKFPIGSTTMVYRATDVNGNTSTCSFTYTVNDFPTASLSCRDTVSLVFDQTCETELKATQILQGNNYGCPTRFVVRIRKTPTGNFVLPNLNANDAGKFYTYQLRNPANNQTCTGKMIVRDTIRPTINCAGLVDTTFTLGALQCAVLPNFSLPPANDNCGIPTYSGTPVPLAPNGQFAEPFPPGVTMQTLKVTDASGNTATCRFKVTVNPYLTQQTMICLGQLNLSLDATCKKDIEADELLSGNLYGCYDYYKIELFRNNAWTNNHVDSSDVGNNYPYRVTYPPTGQTCWGNLLIEDKIPPAVFCKDTVLQCYQIVDSLLLGLSGRPLVVEGCGTYTVAFSDSLAVLGCQGSKIFRNWLVTDGYGNTSGCQSVITRESGKLADLVFPKDTILPCTFGAFPTTAIAGVPTLKGNSVVQSCGIGLLSADTRLPICDGSYKISRLWTATNFCTNQSIAKTQVITVMDNGGPSFVACPKDTLISSNTGQCCGNYRIPNVRLWDNCSRIKKVEAKIPGGPTIVANLINLTFTTPFKNDTVARFDTLFCLPSGQTTITLVATDHCGNTSTCTFKVRVTDLTTPVAFCPGFPTLGLSSDDPNDCYAGDVATISASVLATGSTDDCSPIRITGQRMTPLKPCVTGLNMVNGQDPCNDNVPDPLSEFGLATREATTVKFYCCEAGDTVNVRIRVYQLNPDGTVATLPNGQQIVNSCQARVIVQDISPPACTPPPNVTVACSAFDPSAPPAVSPTTPDNCCAPTFTTSWQTPTAFCGGVNTRRFTVSDCRGNSSTCSQTVTVLFAPTSYNIKFPDDQSVNGCQNFAPTPPTVSNNTGCTKFKAVFTDSIPTGGGPNFCFKILRRWLIYDSCALASPPLAPNFIEIANPAGTTGPSIGPGNANYNTTLNAYRYTQEITVSDAIPPEILAGCTPNSADLICDTTANDPALFNINGINFCETPLQPSITVRDGCAGTNVAVSYNLILDYEENGTPDLVVNSASPTAGWGIASTVAGGQKVVTVQGPGGNFPQGKHVLTWSLTDLCGNTTTCRDTLIVRDCKPPIASCKAPFSRALLRVNNSVSVTVLANELNQNSSDNCTPTNQLLFALRIKNTGTGYPQTTSLVFNCVNLGPQVLEMWVRDLAGNTAKCETTVTITDPSNFCNPPSPAQVSGFVKTNSTVGLRDVHVLFGDSLDLDAYGMAMTDSTGRFEIANLPGGTDIQVTPTKNVNPLNGVSTFDLLLISKHVLGVQPFDTPAKLIAADANRSNSISSVDIVELRRLILGLNQNFTNNTSWRFIPKTYVFPDPLNPFLPGFPEKLLLDSAMIVGGNVDFLAIKTGDVNGNASVNFAGPADDRNGEGELPPLIFQTEEQVFSAGELVRVPVHLRPGQSPGGFQMTLQFDPEILEIEKLQPGAGMSDVHFGWLSNRPGHLTISWHGPHESPSFSLIFKTLRPGLLSQCLFLSDAVTPREAFLANGQWVEPMLFFGDLSETDNHRGERLEVFQNQPNPFDDETEIWFFLPQAAPVKLRVSTASGAVLLTKSAFLERGHQFFKVKNVELGAASGLLWYTIETPTEQRTRRMLLK